VDVTVDNFAGVWKVSGWGQCRPIMAWPDGLNPAEWRVDFEQPLPGSATTGFDALVTERSCASGKSSEGRVVGPQVIWSDEIVLVAFAVRACGLNSGHRSVSASCATRASCHSPIRRSASSRSAARRSSLRCLAPSQSPEG
jgi:hypothetical protein